MTGTEPYAQGIAASLRAGAHNSASVMVIAPDGENVAWGPPSWTYRARAPRVLAPGDLLLAELFPRLRNAGDPAAAGRRSSTP